MGWPPCLARDCRTAFYRSCCFVLLFLCFRYVYLFVVLLVSRGRYPLGIFLLLLCTNPVLGIRSPMFSKSDDMIMTNVKKKEKQKKKKPKKAGQCPTQEKRTLALHTVKTTKLTLVTGGQNSPHDGCIGTYEILLLQRRDMARCFQVILPIFSSEK